MDRASAAAAGGAVLVLAGGAIHLQLNLDDYGNDDILTAFALNAAASALVAAYLVLRDDRRRSVGRYRRDVGSLGALRPEPARRRDPRLPRGRRTLRPRRPSRSSWRWRRAWCWSAPCRRCGGAGLAATSSADGVPCATRRADRRPGAPARDRAGGCRLSGHLASRARLDGRVQRLRRGDVVARRRPRRWTAVRR